MKQEGNGDKGVSLIALIITIIVILIIAITAVVSGLNSGEEAKKSKLVSDLDHIMTLVEQRGILVQSGETLPLPGDDLQGGEMTLGNKTYKSEDGWVLVHTPEHFMELKLNSITGEYLVNYELGQAVSVYGYKGLYTREEIISGKPDDNTDTSLGHEHVFTRATSCPLIKKCAYCMKTTGAHNYIIMESDETNHWYRCEKCESQNQIELHTTDGTIATCIQKTKCMICGRDFGAYGAHDWNDWVVIKPATCMEKGTQRRICKLSSSHVETEDSIPIDPNAHGYGDWIITKVATCTMQGERMKVCRYNASHKIIEAVAMLPHEYSSTFNAFDDTNHWKTCSKCGGITGTEAHAKVMKEDVSSHWNECTKCAWVGSKENHNWGNWTEE